MSSSTDTTLGEEIGQTLKRLGIETPQKGRTFSPGIGPSDSIAISVGNILKALGLDISNDSLQKTPDRVAKMYCQEIFTGLDYENFPRCTTIANNMEYDELLTTKCSVISMCEHHFVPFQGFAFIGYLPSNKILGLSKFNRITDFFSRRPQVQERLTAQIHAALSHILDTEDVAVVLSCEHLCVKMRGIKDHQSTTSTSKMSGKFRSVDALRAEFFSLLFQKDK